MRGLLPHPASDSTVYQNVDFFIGLAIIFIGDVEGRMNSRSKGDVGQAGARTDLWQEPPPPPRCTRRKMGP